MRPKKYPVIGLWLGMILGVSLASAAPFEGAEKHPRPGSLVLVEGGYAVPYGDLGSEFLTTRLGFGAAAGLELGFRYRYHFSPVVSLSPAFHFVDFGNFNSTAEDIGEYRISNTSYRYTLEMMFVEPGPASRLRPFLAVAGGIYRNRTEGFHKDFVKAFDNSENSWGYSLRLGLRFRDFELSGVYNVNRFHSWRFYETGYDECYNWDSLSVRCAWALPLDSAAETDDP